jgi:hypothetical protein
MNYDEPRTAENVTPQKKRVVVVVAFENGGWGGLD